jgi:hypothetical protein
MTHANGLTSQWTPQAVETLTALTIKGKTRSEIADAIWEKYLIAFSPSAVIGKQHRLGLQNKRPPKTNKEKARSLLGEPKVHRWIDFDDPAWDEQTNAPLKLTLLELGDHQCHWPLNEKRDGQTLYCGQPNYDADVRYCYEHFRRK